MRRENYELTVIDKPRSIASEAYRTLRTNLGFAGIDQTFRSILVSSPSPKDGKSTVTANLGVVMAQAGSRVLIVDCDLRKPVQHHIFKLDNHKGFTNCLMMEATLGRVLQKAIPELGNLDVLTSGPIPPNPAEMLNSQRVREFWPMLLDQYDFVLVDAPPVLAVADASILASQMDGVIMVARYGVTRKEQVQQTREVFQKANAKLIGVVLNQAKMSGDDYNCYYYYSSADSTA